MYKPKQVSLGHIGYHPLVILEEAVRLRQEVSYLSIFVWTTGRQERKKTFTYGPKRLIRWPVLTRPPLAGFEVTTEGQKSVY